MLHVVLFNDEYIVWFSTPNNEIQSEKRSTGIPAQLRRSEQYTQIESSIFEERKNLLWSSLFSESRTIDILRHCMWGE